MNEPTQRPAFGAHVLRSIEARELRQARVILLVMGLLTIAMQGLLYSKLAQAAKFGVPKTEADLFNKLRLAALAGIAVGGVFVVCGIIVYRKPMLATITGLGLYIATILVQAVIDPSTLGADLLGLGVRTAVLIGLVSAVQFARIYERNRRARADFPKASVVS